MLRTSGRITTACCAPIGAIIDPMVTISVTVFLAVPKTAPPAAREADGRARMREARVHMHGYKAPPRVPTRPPARWLLASHPAAL